MAPRLRSPSRAVKNAQKTKNTAPVDESLSHREESFQWSTVIGAISIAFVVAFVALSDGFASEFRATALATLRTKPSACALTLDVMSLRWRAALERDDNQLLKAVQLHYLRPVEDRRVPLSMLVSDAESNKAKQSVARKCCFWVCC